MNNFEKIISSQFSNPRGVLGSVSTFFMNNLNKIQYKYILNTIEKKTPKIILDVGFGNGKLIKKLAKNAPKDIKIEGIELSEDMVNKVKKQMQHFDFVNIRLKNIISTGYPNDHFDFIYSINTVYFWKEINDSYKEIYRILKKDGEFHNVFYEKQWLDKISYTQYGFNKFQIEDIIQLIKDIPFSEVTTVKIEENKSWSLLVKK